MRIKNPFLILLILSTHAIAQNLSDEDDANQVPASQEMRLNGKMNQPDFRDDDFIPASKERRQRQEVQSRGRTPVEEDHGLDENDKYLDDDNYGTAD